MTADILTISRMLFSLLLLAFPLTSRSFTVCYLLCGLTDVLDGFAARKLHTESERGAMLDSTADLIFAFVYAVRVLPHLSLPVWIWIWTAVIAAAKITVILIAGRKAHGLRIEHSFGNKLTGLLLFLLPLSAGVADMKHGAALVCTAATAAVITEIIHIGREKGNT